MQDCCAVGAVALLADPALRSQTASGACRATWAALQGSMRAALSADDQRRLQLMFRQVCRHWLSWLPAVEALHNVVWAH